jgi:uncharacterized membrane protein
MADVELHYPNREKASSKTVKAIVVLLILVSIALLLVVTIGGWEALQGAKGLQILYIAVYLICAFYIARWRSGLLPVMAALATILLIFAAVSAPLWFERDKTGFDDPALESGLLGLVTLIIIPVQLLLVAFAMSGFRQNWQTEVERPVGGGYDERDRREPPGAVAAPA